MASAKARKAAIEKASEQVRAGGAFARASEASKVPSKRFRMADVNSAGQHFFSLLADEVLLLRHAAAMHLRYQESVEDAIRRGNTEVALNILAQQRGNLTASIERTGPMVDGKHTDLYALRVPGESDGELQRVRKQVQP